MTNMFFAGIPLEGSGTRPLEADLYAPAAQGVDYENLSATGNLNIGVVIQYDEHAVHHLNGNAARNDEMLSESPFFARDAAMTAPIFLLSMRR